MREPTETDSVPVSFPTETDSVPVSFPVPVSFLDTTALDGATSLATLDIDQSSSSFSDTRSFAAKQQISVETDLWLQNGVAIKTYLLDFNVVNVPEPTSGFLAAVLMATCGKRKGTFVLFP